MNTTLLRLVPALLLGAAACTEAGPTGASDGEATTEVLVHGDAPSETSESRSPDRAESSGAVEGSVEVRARVYLQTTADGWVEVTDGAEAQRVEASGSDGFKLLARSRVAADSYHRVRVEFERVSGQLSGGLAVGLGGGSALVQVEAGSGGRVVVERSVDLRATAGASHRLDIDLNTAQWAAAAGSTGLVAESAFASAVSITAR